MSYRSKTKYFIIILAWFIWGIAALFYFHTYFLRISIGGIEPILARHYTVDALHLSYVAVSFLYAYLLAQIPAGILVEHYGERLMLVFGALLNSVACFIFGLTYNISLLSFSRFIMGIGAAFSLIIVLSLAKNWFTKKQFAILNALTITLATIGGVLGEAPLTALLEKFDLKILMTIFAIFSLVLGVVAFFIVRDAPPEATKSKEITMSWIHTFKSLGSMIDNGNVWKAGLFAGLLLVPLGTFALLWGSPFLVAEYHIDIKVAELLTSLMFIGGGIGAPLISWLSNKMENRIIWMRLGAACSILLMWMILYLRLPLSVIGGLIFLLGVSISSSALSYVVVRERISGPDTPIAFGLAKMIQALCTGIALPLTGYILKVEWTHDKLHSAGIYSLPDYHYALLIVPLCMLAAFFVALLLKQDKLSLAEDH